MELQFIIFDIMKTRTGIHDSESTCTYAVSLEGKTETVNRPCFSIIVSKEVAESLKISDTFTLTQDSSAIMGV